MGNSGIPSIKTADVTKVIDIAKEYLGNQHSLNVHWPWVTQDAIVTQQNLRVIATLALHLDVIEQALPQDERPRYRKALTAAIIFSSQRASYIRIEGVKLMWPSLLQQIPDWQKHQRIVLKEVSEGNTTYGITKRA